MVLHLRKPVGHGPLARAGEVDLGCKQIEIGQAAGLDVESLLTASLIEWKNWDLFRLFFIVARLGSMNRAAIQLKLSQPTLSRRLTELERSLGAPLFFRDTSGITLTEEGEALYRSAGHMMQAFEGFQRELRESIVSRSSVVKISASEGMTKHWLLPRLKRLRDQDSELQFEVYSTASHRNLAVEDLDFVIRIGDPGDNELIGKRVGQLGFGIYASREYLESRPLPLSLADLSAHRLISLTTDVADNHKVDDNPDLIARFTGLAASSAGIKLSQVAGQVAATSAGFGLALLAIPFAEAEGLVRVLPSHGGSLDIWLLRRRENHLRRQTNQVRLFLEREFSTSRDWLDAGEELVAEISR